MRVASAAGRFVSYLAVLALVACCPACSNSRKPVYPVRARLLVDGKPAAQAQVLFHPSENSPEDAAPAGQTDDQGYFKLTTYANGDGAPGGRLRRNGDVVPRLPRRQSAVRRTGPPQRLAAALFHAR